MLRFRGIPSLFGCAPVLLLWLACGCHRKNPDKREPPVTAPKPALGLTQQESAQVLARVGDKAITLGDYAAALQRMDRYERLRFESQERRKQLLDEIIAVELLADEARRRGLDRSIETQMRMDQALRDEMLRQVRESLPAPESLPQAEVRAYYDAHQKEFSEPERRRISEIVVASSAEAKRVLEKALKATPTEWGQLVRDFSIGRKQSTQDLPLELEGDLGVVSAPGQGGGSEPQLASELLQAAFAIKEVGAVAPEPVESHGRYHILRLTSRTPPRQRTFAEAERSIRVNLVQHQLETSRERMLDDLKKRFPVTVNQSLLASLQAAAK
jgi:peptidyl-prolyl cis-trans isomerase C